MNLSDAGVVCNSSEVLQLCYTDLWIMQSSNMNFNFVYLFFCCCSGTDTFQRESRMKTFQDKEIKKPK